MDTNLLAKLFEHNNWANQQIIQLCSTLNDAQLDAEPISATKGSIRETLQHLVKSQRNYLALLTLPPEERPTSPLAFAELQESARASGEGLLGLVKDEAGSMMDVQRQTRDGYLVDSWVVMVQVINHATEHREQINSMLTALGITPPVMDSWAYGEFTKALILKPE